METDVNDALKRLAALAKVHGAKSEETRKFVIQHIELPNFELLSFALLWEMGWRP